MDTYAINDKILQANIIYKTNENLITPGFVPKLFLWMLVWFSLILSFIWIVDPYGISPFQVTIPNVNFYKPKRLDIDRLIKPYEVWRYQPKTIFMGTSRIQQSIDPSVFDGTDYAPAYNAAIPANKLEENAAYIEQYLKLDPNIKDIFIELFLYNFIERTSPVSKKTGIDVVKNYLPLQMSSDAFVDAIKTILVNFKGGDTPAYIAKRGFRVQRSDFNPADTFGDGVEYIKTVIRWNEASKMRLESSGFDALDRIVAIAKRHNIKLHLLITPNYPWDDYRLLTLGYWPMLEEWLRKMAAYPNVVSFSQYNRFLEEPPTHDPRMIWWHDPIHFSPNMGRAMMQTYLGHANKSTPANLMRVVDSAKIESLISERRQGVLRWAAAHPEFVTNFEALKVSTNGLVNKG